MKIVILSFLICFFITIAILPIKDNKPHFIFEGIIRNSQKECEDNGYFFQIYDVEGSSFKYNCVNELGARVEYDLNVYREEKLPPCADVNYKVSCTTKK